MRRNMFARIGLILVIPAVGLLLTSLPGGGRGLNFSREELGMSLLYLAVTLSFRGLWPEPGQVDRASLVFMAVSMLPSWLVARGARWRIRWWLVAHSTWGMLLLIALTAVVAALLGNSGDALFLGVVVIMLNVLGSLIVMMARLPAGQRQR